MKKTLLTLVLLLVASGAFAQKSVTDVQTAIRQYRFADAEKQLNTEIAALRRKKQSTLQAEEQLRQVRQSMQKLNATERVTFIDSLVIPRTQLFQNIQLSSESGRVTRYADFFHTADSLEGSVFCSQLGDKIYFSKADVEGVMRLYSSDLIGSTWSDAQPLEGLGNSGSQDYPFMMADGTTLYYAAQGDQSLGGYDIFMTRYDADTRTYLAPENIGMPFNSPANDYLYAIDEYYNLGFFATDRNQPKDSVCIYVFVPNATRLVYNPEETGAQELRNFARLNSIQATQTDVAAVEEARTHLAESRQEQAASQPAEFELVINDSQTYKHYAQFHSDEARQQAKYWVEGTADAKQMASQLDYLRQKYAAANTAQRAQLTPQISELETKHESLLTQLKSQEKSIRNLENKALGR